MSSFLLFFFWLGLSRPLDTKGKIELSETLHSSSRFVLAVNSFVPLFYVSSFSLYLPSFAVLLMYFLENVILYND